ncbi:MAG: efflux RND transporter permease subunit [Actinomycetes bacterium]
MQRFWSWLAVRLGKHAGIVTVVGLVFTIVIGAGITRLEFATGQDSYLSRDSQIYKDNVEYQNLFGGQAMLSVIEMNDGQTVDQLFTTKNNGTLLKVTQDLEAQKNILGVISPLTALDFSDRLVGGTNPNIAESIAGKALLAAAADGRQSDESKDLRLKDSVATLQRSAAIPPAERRLDNPEWVKFLLYDNQGEIRTALRPFFPNKQHALTITRLKGNLSIEDEGAASDRIEAIAKDLVFPNATTTTTGAPVLLKGINDYLKGGMLTLGGIAVAVMIVILMLFFQVRWRLLPLAVVLVGVVWAFGLAGYVGIPLTLVTIAGLPVMLGIGIDYAIQMHSRIEEEVIIDSASHPIQEAARGLGPALLVVTFDAVFAFLAIQLSKVPMIREFGWLLTVGIVAICVSSIINPLAVLGMREYRSPTKGRDFSEGRLGRAVEWLGALPPKSAWFLAGLSVVVFVLGSIVEPNLKLETDPINWVNPNTQVVKDIRKLEDKNFLGGSSELGVFVSSTTAKTLFTTEAVEFTDEVTRSTLRDYSNDLLVASGIVATVSDLIDVPGADHVPPTAESVQAAYEVAPDAVKVSTVAQGGRDFNVIYLTKPGSLEERAKVVEHLRNDTKAPPGIRLTPSGLAVVGVGLLENLEANLVQLTWAAAGLVFLFLLVRLRSATRAVLSMVPVLVASGVATLGIYLLGIELSPMTAVGGPLVVATCTEFTSLILLRYIEERRRGHEPREAIDITARRTGRAFIVSAMTAISGVAVISFSSLPLLRNFGIFVALKIAIALLAALVVLPPLIVWADDPRRNWVSKGMLDQPVAPFIPVEPARQSPQHVAAAAVAGEPADPVPPQPPTAP